MRTRRGALLITVMLIVVVLFMLVVATMHRLRGSAFANRGSQDDHLALLAAESGLALSLSHLSEDDTWTTGVTGTMPDGKASYSVGFGPSVNNLTGTVALDGPRGTASVPPGTATIVVRATSGTRVRTLEAVVARTGYVNANGNGILSTGDVILRGNLRVVGFQSLSNSLPTTADIFSLNALNAAGLISWTRAQPTDQAIIRGDVRIVSPNAGAIQMAGATVTGNPNSYGQSAIPAPAIDVMAQISAKSSNPAPPLSPGLTVLAPGDYYLNGDLTYDGDIELDDANLYVNGNVNLNGTIKGKGSLFVAQSTDLFGDADLRASDADNVAIYSKGSLSLHGFDGTRYLTTLAAASGTDANGVAYSTHFSHVQEAIARQHENVLVYLLGTDTSRFSNNNDEFDRISDVLAHGASYATTMPWTGDPNHTNSLPKILGLVQSQPSSPTRDFVERRLRALYDPSTDTGLYGWAGIMTPAAKDTTFRSFLDHGSTNSVLDVLGDGSTNALYPNPAWSTYTPAEIQRAYHLLHGVLSQISFNKVGAASFHGVLYTNGSIYADNEVSVTGAVIAVDDGSQTPRVIGGRTVKPGDIYLNDGTSITYVSGVAATAGHSIGSMGVVSWTVR